MRLVHSSNPDPKDPDLAISCLNCRHASDCRRIEKDLVNVCEGVSLRACPSCGLPSALKLISTDAIESGERRLYRCTSCRQDYRTLVPPRFPFVD